jgi:hypothetical protein
LIFSKKQRKLPRPEAEHIRETPASDTTTEDSRGGNAKTRVVMFDFDFCQRLGLHALVIYSLSTS